MFTWLSFFDTHHPINGSPSFSSKSRIDLNNLLNSTTITKKKSPFRTYCKYAFERHLEEYKQWDFHMKQLYNFMKKLILIQKF